MKIFAFGSSIVSSYCNGAATYYRGCYQSLGRLGHEIMFAEPHAYGRQQHRDSCDLSYIKSIVYQPGSGVEAVLRLASLADIVIKHSGIGVDDELLEQRVLECRQAGVAIFWDVDAPATIARMKQNPKDPFIRAVPQYDAIFTRGGGPMNRADYLAFGARTYYCIYNGVDPETHYPVAVDPAYECDLVFVGNRIPDREKRIDELFLKAAEQAPEKRFLLGGEGWGGKQLPRNVRWIGHVPTAKHNRIHCSAEMVIHIDRVSPAGYESSPPARIFEAAGAAACMLCDDSPGLSEFFEPEREMIIVRNAEEVVRALREYDSVRRRRIASAFFYKAMKRHTYELRGAQVDAAFRECFAAKNVRSVPEREPTVRLARGTA